MADTLEERLKRIAELEKQIGPIRNEPNQNQTDQQAADKLREGIKK